MFSTVVFRSFIWSRAHLNLLQSLNVGVWLEGGHHDDLLAHVQPGKGDHVHTEDVEHGKHTDRLGLPSLWIKLKCPLCCVLQYYYILITCGERQEIEAFSVHELCHVGHQVALGELHPLGRSGRAGREGQHHRGVGIE